MLSHKIFTKFKLKSAKFPVFFSGSKPFSTESNTKEYSEVKIPVPWGHIAGKWWGPQDKRPILMLHGWQDNCGSFDRVIPLLPNHIGYLAIDQPGHGRSSHLPPGMFYHFMNGPMTVKYIKEYFEWPKITLCSHSLGAITSFTYSTLFPESVDFIICMDALNPLLFKNRLDMTAKTITDFMKYNNIALHSQSEPPAYTIEEMEQMLHKASRKSVYLETAKYILNRNIFPSVNHPGKFYFSRDVRLKCGSLLGWTLEDCLEAANRANFPLLFTVASKTKFDAQKEGIFKVVEVIKAKNENFVMHAFDGTHHVHLNDPQQVANAISPFILKYDKEERAVGVGDIKKCLQAAKL